MRVGSDGWHPQATAMVSYEATWVALGWWMWLAVLYVVRRNAPRRAVWLWLTPASLYFTLFRIPAGFISGRRPQSLAGDAKIGAIAEDSGKAEGMT